MKHINKQCWTNSKGEKCVVLYDLYDGGGYDCDSRYNGKDLTARGYTVALKDVGAADVIVVLSPRGEVAISRCEWH